jgi:tetratricopeptide (TPR) repeat protein
VPRQIVSAFALTFLLLTTASAVFPAQDDAERLRAFQLFKDAKFNEALPLFEQLAAKYPEDPEVLEKFGLLVIGQTAYLKEPNARKEARRRGREILVRAQKLGADSALLKSMIEGLPADGGDDKGFSTKKEVDDAMREGEAAFAKRDMPKALEMYQHALLLDPTLYEAALYTGDVYYAQADQRKASEWFGRAASLNPDRETAYRYWGDSLMKQGKATEAGEKFVEAYIAEPYSRLARAGFLNWAQKVNIAIAHPQVEVPASVTAKGEGEITINLDPNALKKDDKGGSAAAWLTYSLIRASWPQTEFAKQYPNEKQYRHSLKEEAAAFRAAIKVIDEQKNKDLEKVDRSLRLIARLDKEGFLEAFILLAMPDAGIANDFVAYRKNNLDTLRRYVKQYVLTGGGQ